MKMSLIYPSTCQNAISDFDGEIFAKIDVAGGKGRGIGQSSVDLSNKIAVNYGSVIAWNFF
jgi:hypothetical protein